MTKHKRKSWLQKLEHLVTVGRQRVMRFAEASHADPLGSELQQHWASSFARLGTFFEVGTRIHCVSNALISHVNVNTVCTTPLALAQRLMSF